MGRPASVLARRDRSSGHDRRLPGDQAATAGAARRAADGGLTCGALTCGALTAYDAATGNVILFSGCCGSELDDTWTWDGTTWTQQHPAASPPARDAAAMAYDAATGNVVLFGGELSSRHQFGDTWVWDGSTWTQQHPATSPSARRGAAMAYDAATSNVVLFGGLTNRTTFDGTWTWG